MTTVVDKNILTAMTQVTKNKNGELVTQGILKFELKKALGSYPTKNELGKAFDDERKKNVTFFASKQDLKDGLENLKQDLKTDINKNQTYLEKIVAKLDKKEQEDTMHGYQHKIAEDRLANHDKRLEKLEKSTGFAH